ncbi:oocyte zinc finger protein XlCOF6-like [Cylas formicarius]|uniref:oocyte zinc finger protein XlCOF6-like n=1 Tax=Cylas formicarius TaxID=197179 RepID=UPI0029588885|nr:oocyte zinc finger protein XlCOF6-like [Cylas formicarius]
MWAEPNRTVRQKDSNHRSKLNDWNCSKCREVFPTKTLLRRHRTSCDGEFAPPKRKTSSKKNTWSCKICLEVFSTKKLLQVHKKTHVADTFDEEVPSYRYDVLQELYICATCSAEFQDTKEAEDHIQLHVEKLTCKSCDAIFTSPYDLGIHSIKHDDQGKVQCPLCSYTSYNTYSFKAHVNYVHLKKFPFYCATCGKGFKQYKVYQEHQNTHVGVKPFVCVVCSKAFCFHKYLIVHQVRNHQVGTTGDRIENECRRCNRYFFKKETLEQHQAECLRKKKEKKEKSHLCDTCGQSFTEKAKLVEHLRVHAGDNPFVCSWCGKGFPKRDYLKCHERVHTGEKPYSCEFCGKRFSHHSPFRVHRRTHTGERPYVCTFCSKGFTTNQGLKLHKKNCPENQLNNMIKYGQTE